MGNRRLDLSGKTINGIKVLSFYGMVNGRTNWNCICRCGDGAIFVGSDIKKGCAGCGCKRGRECTHGMSKTKFFCLWQRIISRCYRKTNASYDRYGGRGIKVCDRWLESFQNFYDDMYSEYIEVRGGIPDCQIDRIDNDGDYTPDNCRFVSPKENANNRDYSRVRVLNDFQVIEVMDMYFSGKYSNSQIAKVFGVGKGTIRTITSGKMYKNITS